MSTQMTGRARVFGTGGITIQYGAAAVRDIIDSANLTHNADVDELTDGDGEPIGYAGTNERYDIVIDFVPVAATTEGNNTKANALGKAELPPLFSLVALTGFGEEYDGDYIYKGGGSRAQTKAQNARLTLPLCRQLNTPEGVDLSDPVA
jgi:hypothetical protein